jgi:hypothetical protein
VDPTGKLLYSTAVPGNAAQDASDEYTNRFAPTAIHVDASGQVIVAGYAGDGLPTTPGVIGPSYDSSGGFVLQLNATASALNYASYLPGTDQVGGLAVDSSGDLYLAGETYESNLPTSQNAYQKTAAFNYDSGGSSGFVLELNAGATKVQAATYLDGLQPSLNGGTNLEALALDSHGNVFVGGMTGSTDFPLQNPFISEWEYGSFAADMVIAELTPDLSSLSFGSFLNSTDSNSEASTFSDLTLDANDDLIVVGTTAAADFPTTAGSFQTQPPPPSAQTTYVHSFVAKLDMATPAPSFCPANWSVSLGRVNALSPSTQTLNLTNCGDAPLNLGTITSSVDTVTASQSCGAVAPGATCPISITFSPVDNSLSSGTLSFAGNMAVSPQVIPFSGQGLAPVLSPESNPFPLGHYLVGTSSPTYALTLSNLGNATLIFGSVTIGGNGFTMQQNGCTGKVYASGFCTIDLSYAPQAAGAATGTLTLNTNDPVHPQMEVTLTGAGDAAYASPSITRVDNGQFPQQTLPINSGPITLQIAGADFYPQSVVQLNGVIQQSTFNTNGQLSVTIAAASLVTLGEYPLIVVNPGPGGGASPSVTLTTYQIVPLAPAALLDVPATGLIYAAMPYNSTTSPNTVVPIDPATGETKTPIPVGNNPTLLAASDNGAYLYVTNGGDYTVDRIDLSTDTVVATFPYTPTPGCSSCLPQTADDIHAVPGSADEFVLAQGGIVSLFNADGLLSSIPSASAPGTSLAVGSFAFAGNPLTIYAEPFTTGPNPFFTTVNITGSTLQYTQISDGAYAPQTNTGSQILSDGKLLYTNSGEVWDPATQLQTGTFPVETSYDIPVGDLALDSTFGQLYAVGDAALSQDGRAYDAIAVSSYGVKSLAAEVTLSFPAINASEAFNLVRWGTNGFGFSVPAPFTDAGGVYLTRSSALTGQTNPNPAPTLNAIAPSSAAAGSPTLDLTLKGSGFLPSSSVRWKNTSLVTTYVSGAQLVAVVPASDLSSSGTVPITVVNPAPGGGTSAQQTFTIGSAGGSPSLSLSPATLSFGAVLQNDSSAAQSVTLKNSGNATLAISSITTDGDFIQTSTCGPALAPGSSCQAAVVFKPSAVGDRTGQLTVADNASDSPQSVVLSGTGTASIAVTPAAGTSPTATVSSGGTATYDLSVAASSGFSGTVALTCGGAPENATCTVVPTALTLANGVAQTFSVQVATGQSNTAALFTRTDFQLAGFSVGALLLLPFSFRLRRLARVAAFVGVCFCLLFAFTGCGGSANMSSVTTPPTSPTTPAGTYTLTVSATAGAVTASQSLKLVVQ